MALPSSQGRIAGKLHVTVIAASGLRNTERFAKMDPYAVILVGNDRYATDPVKGGGQAPTWERGNYFAIPIADPNSHQIRLQIWDRDLIQDDLVGENVNVEFSHLKAEAAQSGGMSRRIEQQFDIFHKAKAMGTVRLAMQFEPNVSRAVAPPPVVQQQPVQQAVSRAAPFQDPNLTNQIIKLQREVQNEKAINHNLNEEVRRLQGLQNQVNELQRALDKMSQLHMQAQAEASRLNRELEHCRTNHNDIDFVSPPSPPPPMGANPPPPPPGMPPMMMGPPGMPPPRPFGGFGGPVMRPQPRVVHGGFGGAAPVGSFGGGAYGSRVGIGSFDARSSVRGGTIGGITAGSGVARRAGGDDAYTDELVNRYTRQ